MKDSEHAATEAPIWTERFRIRSYDVDGTRRATLPKLCGYFVEAAWNHAEALGFGFTHLRNQGKFWVLSRLRCEMEIYPSWGDEVTLHTWPRGFEGVFAFRDFELVSDSGARLGAGTSSWLVLDSVSKRPQRLHKILPGRETMTVKAALGGDAEKLEDNDTWDSEVHVAASHSDIDVNQHVTSSRYIGWVLDSYPIGFHAQNSVPVLEVNYLNETVEGDEINVRTRESAPGIYLHTLAKADGTEVCRARLEWRQNEGRAISRA